MPFRHVANTTPVDKTEPPRHVIPSERSESRNPPKQQVLSCGGSVLLRGGFLHSACAPVGMTQRGDVSGFCWEQFRPFRCGTAHRPFPTVSLVGGRFQPGCSKDGRCGVVDCGNNRRKGNPAESHLPGTAKRNFNFFTKKKPLYRCTCDTIQ